jgi:hypothetical protein
VKVAVSEADDTEVFWIAPFEQRGSKLTGEINNTPQLVKKVKPGQTIAFRNRRSWTGSIKMAGSCAAILPPALLKREPRNEAEQFVKQLGLRCDP